MIAEIQSNALVRRVTFVAAHVAIMLAACWLWVIPLWDIFADRDARIAEQHALLRRLEGVAAREGAVQDLVRNAAAEINRGELLTGANDGMVGADLQTRLKAITEAGGARLQSVQSLPSTHNGAVKYVGARIELIGTLAAIQRAIHAVESGKPYLFVTAAALKSSSPIARPDLPAEPVVDAQLEVFGALRVEGAVR
jgi:general secretion pathway protein M